MGFFSKTPIGPPQLPGKPLFGKRIPLTGENMMILKRLRNSGNMAGYKNQKNRLRYAGRNVSQANSYLAKTNAYGVKTQLRNKLAERVNGRTANVNYVKARFGNKGIVKAAASLQAGTGSFTNKVGTSIQSTGVGFAAGARSAAASTRYRMGTLKNRALSLSLNAFKSWQMTNYKPKMNKIQQNLQDIRSQAAAFQSIRAQIALIPELRQSVSQLVGNKTMGQLKINETLAKLQDSVSKQILTLKMSQAAVISQLRTEMQQATRGAVQRTKEAAISAGQGMAAVGGRAAQGARAAAGVAVRAPVRAGQVAAGMASGAWNGGRRAATAPLRFFGKGRGAPQPKPQWVAPGVNPRL